MSQTIEVIYENNVLKPTSSVKGLKEHGKLTVILCTPLKQNSLRKLSGTISHKEAEKMKNLINKEFEGIEGEW